MGKRPPGFLRQNEQADLVMMVCTAGHVDHGKTALVRALTGCRTDRLKTEQERGLTIELGFAPCFLKRDVFIGIVDVPGHEKFVKNMVTGVSGIGMAILVVAADDGVMPQTVEHCQIMELLGLERGIVALTKTDLVAPERVQEVTAELTRFLKGSFLEGADICPLSARTHDGVDDFFEKLVTQVKQIRQRRSAGVFRMPVLKTFTSEGYGSVVTGIPIEGGVKVGTPVELVPGGQRGKVRGIQRFLRDADAGGFGQCLALNIPEFSKRPPVRGQVLGKPGYIKACLAFHLNLKTVATLSRPLKNAEQVIFHTGTEEVQGKLYLLEEKNLPGGARGIATIMLSRPVAAAVGDKCLIRRLSPVITAAGGDIAGMSEKLNRPRKKRTTQEVNDFLQFFQGVSFDSDEGLARRVAYCLSKDCPYGAAVSVLSRGTLLNMDAVKEILAALVKEGAVLALGTDLFIHQESYQKFLAAVREKLKGILAEGDALTLPLNQFREGWDAEPALWERIEKDLASEGLMARRGDKIVLESAMSDLQGEDKALADRILAIYEETGFASPRPAELAAQLKCPDKTVDRLLDYLTSREVLFRLSKNVVIAKQHLKTAQDRVLSEIREKGALNSADFKYHIDSSRKYALAILDFLDARNITVRIGNDRKLAPHYQRNLL